MFRIISCLMLTATLTAGFACPAAADDPHTCYEKTDDVGLAACNRVINSRRYSRSQRATAYINRGQDWYDRRELDKAIADFNQALRINPKKALVYTNRGNAYHLKKDHERALDDYGRALKLDPEFAAAYAGRGLIYEIRGDLKRARTEFEAALAAPKKYPDSEWAHKTARRHLDNLDKAKK